MLGRLRRVCAVCMLGAALFAVGFGSAGAVSADIDPAAFQKLGCNNADLACFYTRLGGLPATIPYCTGSSGNDCTYIPVNEGYPYFAPGYGPISGGVALPPPSQVVLVPTTDPNIGVVVVPPPPQGTLMPALNH